MLSLVRSQIQLQVVVVCRHMCRGLVRSQVQLQVVAVCRYMCRGLVRSQVQLQVVAVCQLQVVAVCQLQVVAVRRQMLQVVAVRRQMCCLPLNKQMLLSICLQGMEKNFPTAKSCRYLHLCCVKFHSLRKAFTLCLMTMKRGETPSLICL